MSPTFIQVQQHVVILFVTWTLEDLILHLLMNLSKVFWSQLTNTSLFLMTFQEMCCKALFLWQVFQGLGGWMLFLVEIIIHSTCLLHHPAWGEMFFSDLATCRHHHWMISQRLKAFCGVSESVCRLWANSQMGQKDTIESALKLRVCFTRYAI